jgi:hypothetical protein
LGEEKEATQGMANIHNMDTDHREKTVERPNQPNTRPRRKARTTSRPLGKKKQDVKRTRNDRRKFIEELT